MTSLAWLVPWPDSDRLEVGPIRPARDRSIGPDRTYRPADAGTVGRRCAGGPGCLGLDPSGGSGMAEASPVAATACRIPPAAGWRVGDRQWLRARADVDYRQGLAVEILDQMVVDSTALSPRTSPLIGLLSSLPAAPGMISFAMMGSNRSARREPHDGTHLAEGCA